MLIYQNVFSVSDKGDNTIITATYLRGSQSSAKMEIVRSYVCEYMYAMCRSTFHEICFSTGKSIHIADGREGQTRFVLELDSCPSDL